MARVRHLRLFLFKILSIHPHLSPSSFALEPRASLSFLPSFHASLSLSLSAPFPFRFQKGCRFSAPDEGREADAKLIV